MRARGCQGHKIVTGGEGNAFQNGLYDVGSARIGSEPDKGAARLGVIQGRAFTRKIREELDGARGIDGGPERFQQVGLASSQHVGQPGKRRRGR